MESKIIVVLGPTASGKSELAVKIAKRFNGEIISADSRQVYKGLDLGSGKVPISYESRQRRGESTKSSIPPKGGIPMFYKGIRHHLLDVASPKRTFTVAQYQKLAQKAIKQILKRGKIPIICGGTGLYIDSVVYGTKFPEVMPQSKLRQKLEKLSTEELFEKLQKLDARRSQNIDFKNRRRLIRALEIVIATKSPVPAILSDSTTSKRNNHYEFLKIGIKKSPEELKKRIKKRLLRRLKIGMVEEVENLRKQGLSWKRLDNLGLEYRDISRYLREISQTNADLTLTNAEKKGIAAKAKKEMEDLIVKESAKYAKRQMTWFKRDPEKSASWRIYEARKKIYWIEKENEAFNLIKEFK